MANIQDQGTDEKTQVSGQHVQQTPAARILRGTSNTANKPRVEFLRTHRRRRHLYFARARLYITQRSRRETQRSKYASLHQRATQTLHAYISLPQARSSPQPTVQRQHSTPLAHATIICRAAAAAAATCVYHSAGHPLVATLNPVHQPAQSPAVSLALCNS